MESTLNLWSARPEEQNVAARLTVTPALYRDAFIFKTRDRPIHQVAGTEIYILQTSDCEPDEMVSMFSELCNSTFDDWSRYKEIKERYIPLKTSSFKTNDIGSEFRHYGECSGCADVFLVIAYHKFFRVKSSLPGSSLNPKKR
uniref:Uncharacterized protein n=1 Tax=Ditylenchus dipsaci TaxID=166011 RepID=A0A915EGR0_9BILA